AEERRPGTARARSAALPLPGHQPSSADDRSLHDAGGGPDGRRRPRAVDRRRRAPSAVRVPPELRAARRLLSGERRTRRVHAEFVLRVPEACEGLVRTARGAPRASRLRRGYVGQALMFSLHVDTARTWRGGQNQVMLTVLGMRALGHRATLVAHAAGELRQRAAEGLDLVPLAPVTEMDLSAAWNLSRLM